MSIDAPDRLCAPDLHPWANMEYRPSIPELVAEVYMAASPPERGRLLEQLLLPLGVLSLVAIAGGIFAKIRLRSGWQPSIIRPDDIQGVRADDVIALVDYVQQVSIESIEGLVRTLQSSPVTAGSVAVALLGQSLNSNSSPPRPPAA